MRFRSIISVALCLVVSSCGATSTDTETSADALMGVITDTGGSIISYESLQDQILDSDAVVSGTILGVEAAGQETADDGAQYPLHYIHALLEVDEVFYTAGVAPVEKGQILRIEMPQPDLMSVDEANQAVSGTVGGYISCSMRLCSCPELGRRRFLILTPEFGVLNERTHHGKNNQIRRRVPGQST